MARGTRCICCTAAVEGNRRLQPWTLHLFTVGDLYFINTSLELEIWELVNATHIKKKKRKETLKCHSRNFQVVVLSF